jgi:hypothetical protein
MPKAKFQKMTYMTLRLPEELVTEFRAACRDPFTNRVKYGETSAVATRLIRGWLDQKKPGDAKENE